MVYESKKRALIFNGLKSFEFHWFPTNNIDGIPWIFSEYLISNLFFTTELQKCAEKTYLSSLRSKIVPYLGIGFGKNDDVKILYIQMKCRNSQTLLDGNGTKYPQYEGKTEHMGFLTSMNFFRFIIFYLNFCHNFYLKMIF